jgi:hypothetical protein
MIRSKKKRSGDIVPLFLEMCSSNKEAFFDMSSNGYRSDKRGN